MRSRVETVTPAMARKWIESSEDIRQRGIRANRVAKLEHAIRSGQWQVTHQGIALSPEGKVLDGQHRLRAIIAADEPVQCLVIRGVDPAVFGVIDTGASRTPADALKIAGYTNTNVLAAVVRTMLVYDQVKGTNGNDWTPRDREVTSADILGWLEADDGERLAAAHASMKGGQRVAAAVSRFGATTPIAAALLILNLYETDVTPTIRHEFVERLCDGVLLGPRSPILALRRWLVADTGYVMLSSHNNTRRMVTIACVLKAVNDYALGHERSLTVFKIGKELLPTPIPPGAIKAEMVAREADLEREEARA